MSARVALLALALLAMLAAPSALAQAADVLGPPAAAVPGAPIASNPASINPISILEGAARALPNSGAGAGDGSGGTSGGGLSTALNIVVLMTVLSLAPAIMIMCTCFVRIIVVLSLLKQALGTQTLPPSQVILGLSLFMTFVVMGPTFQRVHAEAVVPYERGEIASQLEMWDRASLPLRDFMFDQIEATGNWSSLYMMLEQQGVDTSEPERLTRADVGTFTLIPAFMLSELKTAFLMGFRVYLPFLVIDMVISSLLISMSMMMLPPVLISLPFKILLFVLVDGWNLVVGSLMTSFAQPGAIERLSERAAVAAGALGVGG